MKNLLFKNNVEVIYLNKVIYSKKSIKKGIKVYDQFINFKTSENSNYLKIKIKSLDEKKYTSKILADEFVNYLIALEYEISNVSNVNKNK
ncbi:MAG: HxsD-like protein [Nanoarchaeota archaeon]